MRMNASGVSALTLVLSVSAFADDEAANRPVVRPSESGAVYAKSVPDESYGQKGMTRVFGVGKDNDTLICEYDWYANEICIGGPGDATLIRFGPWQRGREPQDGHLALGIYRNGKTIREYSTPVMAKLGSGVSTSVSHYTIFAKHLGFRRLKGDSCVYEVECVSGKVVSFDLDSGAVAENTPEHAAADKAIVLATQKVAATAEKPQDYKLIGAQQTILKGRYSWIVTFKPTELLPPDPSIARIGAGGEVFVNVDVQTDATEIRRGE